MLTPTVTAPAVTDDQHELIMSLAREYAQTGRATTLNRVEVWLAMDKGFDVPTIRSIAKRVAGHATHMTPTSGDWQSIGGALGNAALNGFPLDDEGSGP